MQFSLFTAVWLTTLVAVALGVFGNGAIIPLGCTLLAWHYLGAVLRGGSSRRKIVDPTLVCVALGVVLLTAVAAVFTSSSLLGEGQALSLPDLLAYVALSLVPAFRIKSRSPKDP